MLLFLTSEPRKVDSKVDPDGDSTVLPEQLLGPRGVRRHRARIFFFFFFTKNAGTRKEKESRGKKKKKEEDEVGRE